MKSNLFLTILKPRFRRNCLPEGLRLRGSAICLECGLFGLGLSIAAPELLSHVAFGENLSMAAMTVSNVAALQILDPPSDYHGVVEVLGYNSAGDGGGGRFSWNPTSDAKVDSCVTFRASGASTGRWIRLGVHGTLNVEMCGAYSDGTNGRATREAFQRAADYMKVNFPNGTIFAGGHSYLFDGTTVTVCTGSYDCPRFIGGGEYVTKVVFPAVRPRQAAVLFEGLSGSISKGEWSDFLMDGNSNAVGVQINGTGGITVHISMSTNIQTGVVICNCARNMFSEFEKINVDSGDLLPAQQTIVAKSGGGTDSLGYDELGGDVSLGAGTRSNPIITIEDLWWYNGTWDMSVHDIAGGGAATLLNDSHVSIPAYIADGRLKLETTPSSALTITSGNTVYYGGSIYGIGGTMCNGIIPGRLAFVRTAIAQPHGVPFDGNADEYCISETFIGTAGAMLNALVIGGATVTYDLSVFNWDNSYNYKATISVNNQIGGGGECSLTYTPIWHSYIDKHSWGSPTPACRSGVLTLSNPNWSAGTFTASYNAHSQ